MRRRWGMVVTRHPTAIIIPAHNEAAVIVRTLTALHQDAMPGEFSVTVVCNGCTLSLIHISEPTRPY